MRNSSFTHETGWICRGLAALLLSVVSAMAQEGSSEVLSSFAERLPIIQRQIPQLVRAADKIVQRITSCEDALLQIPYDPQPCFAEELVNRAGGLALALPWTERLSMATTNDVVLFSVRSWEKDGAKAVPFINACRDRGWMIVLFASLEDAPRNLKVDFWLDNGASSGSGEEAPINALVNTCNAWMWTCEYSAAMTRRGAAPAVLRSIFLPGAEDFNRPLQTPTGRRTLFACTNAITPGTMAWQYLHRVEQLISGLAGPRTRQQLQSAASIVANQLYSGGKVITSTCTHFLLYESFADNVTPWRPIEVVWNSATVLPREVSKSDVFVWFGYIGMSTPYEDFGKNIRATGARVISSYIPDTNILNTATYYAVGHIEQAWRFGDGEVDVPFPPGRMGPVSGINVGLLYRMLDESVSEELAALHGLHMPVSEPPAEEDEHARQDAFRPAIPRATD